MICKLIAARDQAYFLKRMVIECAYGNIGKFEQFETVLHRSSKNVKMRNFHEFS